MRVGVLAWGSLVWAPANRYGELALAGEWQDDGPWLPVEFARISSDGRLTLVIVPGYPHLSRAKWAMSSLDDLEAAVANLARRETNAPLRHIHGIGPDGTVGEAAAATVGTVSAWMEGHPYLEAVIWTGLPPGPRWGPGGWSPEAAIAYLTGLDEPARTRAREYLDRAPRSIDTPVRRASRDAW